MHNEQNPFISVIIPVYNMEAYVAQAITSVQNQTFRNIEIIVVNDGSTDNSLQIIEGLSLNDERIHIINKENAGLSSAYNAGQRIAKGKYIYFLDSDDWLEPDCLNILGNAAEITKAEVVKAYGFIVERKGKSFKQITIPFQKCHKIITNTLTIPEFVNGHVAQWSSLYRRDFLIDNNIWCPEFPKRTNPDVPFTFQVWCCCKRLYVVNRFFVHYRTDNDNSVKNSGAAMSFRLMRGHLATRARMAKKFLSMPYWHVKTAIEFKHFMYELTIGRCNKHHWQYLQAISKIFKENIKYKRVDFKKFTFETKIVYKIIAYAPWLYWLNIKLHFYGRTFEKNTGERILRFFFGAYTIIENKNKRKVYLFGHLINGINTKGDIRNGGA